MHALYKLRHLYWCIYVLLLSGKKEFFCLFFPVSVEKSANNLKIIISFLHWSIIMQITRRGKSSFLSFSSELGVKLIKNEEVNDAVRKSKWSPVDFQRLNRNIKWDILSNVTPFFFPIVCQQFRSLCPRSTITISTVVNNATFELARQSIILFPSFSGSLTNTILYYPVIHLIGTLFDKPFLARVFWWDPFKCDSACGSP